MYTYRSTLPGVPYADIPNDGLSLTAVLQLLNKGFLEQVLLSMDVCLKTCLAAYGGPGYAHIQEVGVRMMADKGLTNDQIEIITTRNPARALSLS
jgi:phosphotriesterase-related protein